jgi:ABC-2 type transport system ATP-binding protein
MIEAVNLSQSYKGQKVLNGVSFSLEKGHVLGILGPNGAGKTTLLKILALIARAEHGSVFFDGRDAASDFRHIHPIIGYVPQDVALFEDLSVLDNLLCWSRQSSRAAKIQARRIIQELSLDAFSAKKVSALSGGMKRRVNLAVALLDDPEVLILDEPFVGVDIEQRRQIIKYLKAMAEKGVTQLIASHHVEELIPLADELMVIKDGDIRFHGKTEIVQAQREENGAGTTMDEIVLDMLNNDEGEKTLL